MTFRLECKNYNNPKNLCHAEHKSSTPRQVGLCQQISREQSRGERSRKHSWIGKAQGPTIQTPSKSQNCSLEICQPPVFRPLNSTLTHQVKNACQVNNLFWHPTLNVQKNCQSQVGSGRLQRTWLPLVLNTKHQWAK